MLKRTHNCNELRIEEEGKEIILNGWVNSSRDHGGLIFIDLRDRFGMTQIVFDPQINKDSHKIGEALRREDVIGIKGKVRKRAEGMSNPKMETGEIEIYVDEMEIFTKAETPPIEVDDRIEASDEVRLKYRYLDLRRPVVIKKLVLRHKAAMSAREYFNKKGFLEIETPMLMRSTPEGARDYIVPSRVNPGNFYALPQSPQLYKQILMIAGADKYFQMPRCLRDEDLRADRQPEHTQLDFEMSFIDETDIMGFVEGLFKHMWKEVLDVDIEVPFKRFTYKEAMDKYGIDKPDIRFDMFLHDVTDIVTESDFSVFKEVVKNGGIIKCINPEKDFPRKEIDGLIEFTQKCGAKGMAWMRVSEKGLESNIAKYFNPEVQKKLIEKVGAKPGSILMFIADKEKACNDVLSRLRIELADRMEIIPKDDFKFCWVTDFPLFSFNEDTQAWEPEHHIFSMPKPECMEFLDTDPGKVIGNLFDIALNGTELASGSIRINVPKIQKKVMEIIGLPEEKAMEKFGFLLEAYNYGAPPHGGMGLGFDRIVALMCGTNDIREVIAFPKNKAAQCPMDDSPSPVDEEQLKELHVKVDFVKKKDNPAHKKLLDFLKANNIEFEEVHHDSVFTSEEAAKARGTELKQGAKGLILKIDGGKYVQVVVSAAKDVDLEKIKGILEVQKVELADAKEVKKVSDCNIGSVHPFGNLFNVQVYIDNSLMENEFIAFNAGSHTKSVKMKANDFKDLSKGKVCGFSK